MERQMGVVGERARRVVAVVMRAVEAGARRERHVRRHCEPLVRPRRECGRWLAAEAGLAGAVVLRAKAVAGQTREAVAAQLGGRVLQMEGVAARGLLAFVMLVEEQVASCQRVVVAWASHQGLRGTRLVGACF